MHYKESFKKENWEKIFKISIQIYIYIYRERERDAQSCPTLCDPMGCSPPGFSRQEYWSGLPFPSPGDLPNPGIEPGSPALKADTLTSERERERET